MRPLPLIAIAMGDPNGIGPEIVVKALSRSDVRARCRVVLVGLKSVFAPIAEKGEFKLQVVTRMAELNFDDAVPVIEPVQQSSFEPRPGELSDHAGRIAGECLELAAESAIHGDVDAVVTAPVSKAALNMAGYNFPGQTEFFTQKTKSRDTVMVLMSGAFRVGLVTNHHPLRRVSGLISQELVSLKLKVLHRDLRQRFGIADPKIAVTGLNPHVGEGGLFGTEERDHITPAIESARAGGLSVAGPFPADTLFAQIKQDEFDAYLAMYHDQGLIPVKMQSFGKGVNYTAGLPFVRTSPDHGTAFDIAGKDQADSGSMEEAIKVAARLAASGQ